MIDPAWYGGDAGARDAAVASLPRVLVAPRAGDEPEGVELLDVHEDHHEVSATAIREGLPGTDRWVLPEARSAWGGGPPC